jgi:hypothetical protein
VNRIIILQDRCQIREFKNGLQLDLQDTKTSPIMLAGALANGKLQVEDVIAIKPTSII